MIDDNDNGNDDLGNNGDDDDNNENEKYNNLIWFFFFKEKIGCLETGSLNPHSSVSSRQGCGYRSYWYI